MPPIVKVPETLAFPVTSSGAVGAAPMPRLPVIVSPAFNTRRLSPAVTDAAVAYPCALTNAVVATLVSLSAVAGVGALGSPVKVGLASGAYATPPALPATHFAPSHVHEAAPTV